MRSHHAAARRRGTFRPLGPPRSLTDELVARLSEEIRGGKLRPGERLLSEHAMMQVFEVSRTVVREAVARLKAERLVTSRQGLGVFVSTVTRTQVAAVFLSLVITLMPSFLFSGFLFPIATMPYVLQLYTYAFPARYFNDVSRDLFLKGVGLEYLWWNALLLVLYAVVIFTAACLRLEKKVA